MPSACLLEYKTEQIHPLLALYSLTSHKSHSQFALDSDSWLVTIYYAAVCLSVSSLPPSSGRAGRGADMSAVLQKAVVPSGPAPPVGSPAPQPLFWKLSWPGHLRNLHPHRRTVPGQTGGKQLFVSCNQGFLLFPMVIEMISVSFRERNPGLIDLVSTLTHH